MPNEKTKTTKKTATKKTESTAKKEDTSKKEVKKSTPTTKSTTSKSTKTPAKKTTAAASKKETAAKKTAEAAKTEKKTTAKKTEKVAETKKVVAKKVAKTETKVDKLEDMVATDVKKLDKKISDTDEKVKAAVKEDVAKVKEDVKELDAKVEKEIKKVEEKLDPLAEANRLTYATTPDYKDPTGADLKKWVLIAACALFVIFCLATFAKRGGTNTARSIALSKFGDPDVADITVKLPGNWYPMDVGTAVKVENDEAKIIMTAYVTKDMSEAQKAMMEETIKSVYGAEDFGENQWKIVEVVDADYTNLGYIKYYPEKQLVVELVFENVSESQAETIFKSLS